MHRVAKVPNVFRYLPRKAVVLRDAIEPLGIKCEKWVADVLRLLKVVSSMS